MAEIKLPLAYWKWEFLRRNSDYKKVYKDFLNAPSHKVLEHINNITDEFWLTPPIDPELQIPQECFKLPKRTVYFNIQNFRQMGKQKPEYWATLLMQGFVVPSVQRLTPIYHKTGGFNFKNQNTASVTIKEKSREELAEINFLDLRINLNAKMSNIKKAVEKEIDEWNTYCRRGHRVNRTRLNLYSDYLRIFDWSSAMSIAEIAKKLYPGKYSQDNERKRTSYTTSNPSWARVKDKLDAAKELINGGYKFLTD